MLLFMHFLHLFTPLFFPSYDAKVASLLALASFASGYILRPIGGLVFGHFGDKLGRTKMLAISILLMVIPTFIMGICPTYQTIGIWASIIIFTCRLIQSFAVGGETPGATLILVENASPKNQNLASSLINIAINTGGIIAGILGFIFTQPSMPDWGWRIPFLLGAVFGLLGFFIRRSLQETPEFTKVQQENAIVKIPILEVLKKDKKNVLLTIGIAAGILSAGQFSITYLSYTLRQDFLMLTHQVLLITTLFLLLMIVMLFLMGKTADKIGSKQVMSFGLVSIILVAPIALWAVGENNLKLFLFAQFLACISCSALTAPLNVIMKSLYPAQRRYTGCAFSWGIGMIIFAGFTPLILQVLRDSTGGFLGPSIYLVICQCLALLSIYNSPSVDSSIFTRKTTLTSALST